MGEQARAAARRRRGRWPRRRSRAVLFAVLGLPSPALFGGLLAGLVRALAFRRRIAVPTPAMTAAQAVVGVSMGALVDLATLRAVAANWLPVLLVTLGTLLLSLLAGLALRLQPGISPVTGAFALIAGGASGIIVMARELGADERMVAVLQYLRVLLIVVLMPVVATGLYGASPGSGSGCRRTARAGWSGCCSPSAAASSGWWSAGWLRLPVAALLGPLLLAAAVDLSGLGRGAQVPGAVGDRRVPGDRAAGRASASPARAWPPSAGRCRWRWR